MEIKQKGEESIHFDHPEKITIGIVQALWNDSITGKMAQECIDALTSHGIQGDKIIHKTVPGSFELPLGAQMMENTHQDRKSTRLNSSHVAISYAVFCLKKKNNYKEDQLVQDIG